MMRCFRLDPQQTRPVKLSPWCVFLSVMALPILTVPLPSLLAQEAERKSQADLRSDDPDAANAAGADREARLADYLSGCKFVGRFTVDGREDAIPKTEEYIISKCEKLPAANLYRLTARIKYGDVDSEVPLDVPILWSGRTPIITLDGFWIPGMGTFSSRVMIHEDRYAGTWQHDEKGGHMFGRIVKSSDAEPTEPLAPQN